MYGRVGLQEGHRRVTNGATIMDLSFAHASKAHVIVPYPGKRTLVNSKEGPSH